MIILFAKRLLLLYYTVSFTSLSSGIYICINLLGAFRFGYFAKPIASQHPEPTSKTLLECQAYCLSKYCKFFNWNSRDNKCSVILTEANEVYESPDYVIGAPDNENIHTIWIHSPFERTTVSPTVQNFSTEKSSNG